MRSARPIAVFVALICCKSFWSPHAHAKDPRTLRASESLRDSPARQERTASQAGAVPGATNASGDEGNGGLHRPPEDNTERSSRAVRVGLLAQVRADIVRQSATARYHPELSLKRVRPTLRVATTNEELVTFAQLNVVPEAIYLVDLWAEVRPGRAIQVRAGQFKVPFTRYRSIAVGQLALVDAPITATAFGAEWQLGVMVHNGAGAAADTKQSTADLDYALGIFMGSARTDGFARGVSDTYAQPLLNPSDLTEPRFEPRVHPELVARIGQGAADADGEGNSDPKGGTARHHIALSLAWDAAPEAGKDFALRFSPEVLVKAYGLAANLVGYLGFTHDQGVVVPGMLGGHLELAFRRGVFEVAVRHSRIHYLQSLKQAAIRVGMGRLDDTDGAERDSLEQHLTTLELLQFETETLLGLNLYATELFKFQVDGGLVSTYRDSRQSEWLARSQLQFMY